MAATIAMTACLRSAPQRDNVILAFVSPHGKALIHGLIARVHVPDITAFSVKVRAF